MSQIPIFIINLDESTDRLEKITFRLDQLCLNYERFPAVKGSELDDKTVTQYCPDRYIWWTRRDIKLGEIGCFLSHIRLFEQIIKRGLERACILEDDAILSDDFLKWVQSDIEMPGTGDILKLEIRNLHEVNYGIPVKNQLGRDLIFLPNKGVHGTVSYIITRRGAEKALRNLRTITDAFDHALFEYWYSELETYHVFPPVVTTTDESIIGAESRAVKKRGEYSRPFVHRTRRRLRDLNIFYRKQMFLIRLFGILYPFRITRLPKALLDV